MSIADAVKVIEDLLDKSGCGCCADYDEWSAAKARAREFLVDLFGFDRGSDAL